MAAPPSLHQMRNIGQPSCPPLLSTSSACLPVLQPPHPPRPLPPTLLSPACRTCRRPPSPSASSSIRATADTHCSETCTAEKCEVIQ